MQTFLKDKNQIIMINYKIFICTLTLFAITVDTKSLPDFVNLCNKNDPKLSECMLKSSNEILPHILKGNKDLKVPNLMPLFVKHLEQTTGNLQLKLDNITMNGFDTMSVKDVIFDFAKSTGEFALVAKHFEVDGIYDVKGQILILPITGHGAFKTKHDNLTSKFFFQFESETRDNKDYYKLKETKLNWNSEKTYYNLSNLFNGDETLGKEMNKFLTDNSKDVDQELAGSVIEAIRQVVAGILDKLVTDHPIDEIFPTK